MRIFRARKIFVRKKLQALLGILSARGVLDQLTLFPALAIRFRVRRGVRRDMERDTRIG
jgi:hypothetical protein